MADILSVDKRTGISIGLLMGLVPAMVWIIAAWTRVQTQTDRNTTDIATIVTKLDTLNDNLNKTNGNMIELNTKLEGLSSGTTTRVELTPKSSKTVAYVQPASTPQSLNGSSTTQSENLQPQGNNGQHENPNPPQDENNRGGVSAIANALGGTVVGLLNQLR